MRLLAASLALLLLALPATAQEDACSQSDPCTWAVDVDGGGHLGDDLNVTVGDWYVLDSLNFDTTQHTLTLEGYGTSMTLDPLEAETSAPIQFDTPGTFELRDEPTNDTLLLTVLETDTIDDGDDAMEDEDSGNGAPLTPVVALGALLAAVVLRRR